MKLNLDAKTNEERKVKAYLEANASEILTEKINNGVRIQISVCMKEEMNCVITPKESGTPFALYTFLTSPL